MIRINAHYAKNIFNKCMVLLFYFQYGILNFYQYWIAQRDEEDQPLNHRYFTLPLYKQMSQAHLCFCE